MNSSNEKEVCSLAAGDLEAITRIVSKNGDDIAVCVERGLERLEERIEGAEARIYSRITDVEERISESVAEMATR